MTVAPSIALPGPPDRHGKAITTWLYIRFSLVVLVIALGAAVIGSRLFHGTCIETSISAYYYSFTQPIFVAALCAAGVYMICVKGNTDPEDILLNFAGCFAPLIAFVPTGNPSYCSGYGLAKDPTAEAQAAFDTQRLETITFNLSVYLIATGAVLACLAARFAWQKRRQHGRSFLIAAPTTRHPDGDSDSLNLVSRFLLRASTDRTDKSSTYAVTPWDIAGTTAAAGFWLLAVILLIFGDGVIVRHGHNFVAISMFVCIFVVAILNAVNAHETEPQKRWWIFYLSLSAAMALDAITIGILAVTVDGFHHWVIWIEATLIGAFALFWIAQTIELRRDGIRTGQWKRHHPGPWLWRAVPMDAGT